MSTLQDSDLFVVDRNQTNYQVRSDEMSTLEDTDLFVVEREGINYKIEAKDINVGPTGTIDQPVSVLTPLNGAGLNEGEPYEPLSSPITAIGPSGQKVYQTDTISNVETFDPPTTGGTGNDQVFRANQTYPYVQSGFPYSEATTVTYFFDQPLTGELRFSSDGSRSQFEYRVLVSSDGGATTINAYQSIPRNNNVYYNSDTNSTISTLGIQSNINWMQFTCPGLGDTCQPGPVSIGETVVMVTNNGVGSELTFPTDNNFDKFEVGDVVQSVTWSASGVGDVDGAINNRNNWSDGDLSTVTTASYITGNELAGLQISFNPPLKNLTSVRTATGIGSSNVFTPRFSINYSGSGQPTFFTIGAWQWQSGPLPWNAWPSVEYEGKEISTIEFWNAQQNDPSYYQCVAAVEVDGTVLIGSGEAFALTAIDSAGPTMNVDGGTWTTSDTLSKTVTSEATLTFTDSLELANMVGPLSMVDADGNLVVPETSEVTATNPAPIYPAQSFATQMATGTIGGDGKTGASSEYANLFNNNGNYWDLFGLDGSYGFNGNFKFYFDEPLPVSNSVGVTAQSSSRCNGGAYFFFTDGTNAFCDYNRNYYDTNLVTITTDISGPKYVESIQFQISSGANGGSERMSYFNLFLDEVALYDMVPGPANYEEMNFAYPNPDLQLFSPGDSVDKPILRPVDNTFNYDSSSFVITDPQNVFDGDINTVALAAYPPSSSINTRGPVWDFSDTPVTLALDEVILTRLDSPYNGTKGKYNSYTTSDDTSYQASNFSRQPAGQSGTWVSIAGSEISGDNVVKIFNSYISYTLADQQKTCGSVVVCDSSTLEVNRIISNQGEVPTTLPCEVVDVDVVANTMTVNTDVYQISDTVTGPPLIASADDVEYQDGNVLGVSNVSGTWLAGLHAQGAEVTASAPSPESIVFTSMNGDTTAFTGTDATLTSRTWTLEKGNSAIGPWTDVGTYLDFAANESQDGATPWANPPLEANKFYQVKVEYSSDNAASVVSTFNTFKTGDA